MRSLECHLLLDLRLQAAARGFLHIHSGHLGRLKGPQLNRPPSCVVKKGEKDDKMGSLLTAEVLLSFKVNRQRDVVPRCGATKQRRQVCAHNEMVEINVCVGLC